MEPSILVTKINKTTSDTHIIAKKSYITGVQINERTMETQKIITQQAASVNALVDRTMQFQNNLQESTSKVTQYHRKLSVSMNRVEGISASSNASIEELKEKVDTLTDLVSGVNSSARPFYAHILR